MIILVPVYARHFNLIVLDSDSRNQIPAGQSAQNTLGAEVGFEPRNQARSFVFLVDSEISRLQFGGRLTSWSEANASNFP